MTWECQKRRHTFVLYSRYREVLRSLPQHFARLCIPKIHPVSSRKQLSNSVLTKVNAPLKYTLVDLLGISAAVGDLQSSYAVT